MSDTAIRVPGSAARKLAASMVLAACAAPVLVGIAGYGEQNRSTTIVTTAPAPRFRPAAVVRPADDIGWDGSHGGSVTTNAEPVGDIGWDGAHSGSANT